LWSIWEEAEIREMCIRGVSSLAILRLVLKDLLNGLMKIKNGYFMICCRGNPDLYLIKKIYI
jgi:hypothetical protein